MAEGDAEAAVARNRRIARMLLGESVSIARAGLGHLGNLLKEASEDANKGKLKAADTKLAQVQSQAAKIAESPKTPPQTVSIVLDLSGQAAQAREEIERSQRKKDAIDADFKVVG